MNLNIMKLDTKALSYGDCLEAKRLIHNLIENPDDEQLKHLNLKEYFFTDEIGEFWDSYDHDFTGTLDLK